MISKFYLTTMISLVSILAIGILSWFLSSIQLLVIGIACVILIHQSFFVYGMFSIRSNFFFKTIKGKEFFENKNGILFRFDDGPNPIYTPQILDILKAEGIRALFAVTGKNAEQYPEIVERIFRENHIIANHTYTHPLNILFLGYRKVSDEISRTNSIIQRITGEQPQYFCPPIGHKNPVIGRVIKEVGIIPVMWDIRTFDTKLSFDKIMAIIGKKLKSPAIIMFHDAIIPWSKNERESTILAVKETIRILKEKKYIVY